MTSGTGVVEIDVLFEHGTAGIQSQFDAPLTAVHLIDVADKDRSAAIRILPVAKSTGDIDIQLCDTGKLNSTPKAAQAPRYPINAFLIAVLA